MSTRATSSQLRSLIPPLQELRRRAIEFERGFAAELERVDPAHLPSARNLLHYLSLRQHDLRPLQADLAGVGLSSLGRMEPHALATLDAVTNALHALVERSGQETNGLEVPCDFSSGPLRLLSHARTLLGPEPFRHAQRIMVTMPSEAAVEPELLEGLLRAGMDVMRVNCAHDGPAEWRAMIENLRAAERRVGRSCKVYADLAGPKLRTGALPAGPRVLKIRARKDARGTVVAPARVLLWERAGAPPRREGVDCVLPLVGEAPAEWRVGDRLVLRDARGKRRELSIRGAEPGRVVAEATRTIYAETGAGWTQRRGKKELARGAVGLLPEVAAPLELAPGDALVLTRAALPAEPGPPARIHCTLAEAFEQVRVGDPVWFDDGKIGATVVATAPEEMTLQVVHTGPDGGRLRAEKGVNFPQTALRVPALTEKDLDDLAAVAGAVDTIGLSFVRGPEDVELLHERIREHGIEGTGVVLKIENRAAFEDLPRILLTALRHPPVGIMVARGDLAVEVGFERLSEVQEEILWICEAAHVPVIWATQVLEGLAKTGSPSRAEVTDAAMSARTECVMLNKGPHVVRAVDFLTGVLDRMQAHQSKKRAMLRPLSISRLRPFASVQTL